MSGLGWFAGGVACGMAFAATLVAASSGAARRRIEAGEEAAPGDCFPAPLLGESASRAAGRRVGR